MQRGKQFLSVCLLGFFFLSFVLNLLQNQILSFHPRVVHLKKPDSFHCVNQEGFGQ